MCVSFGIDCKDRGYLTTDFMRKRDLAALPVLSLNTCYTHQPTRGPHALVSPPPMSLRHRNLEPYGRWHATVYLKQNKVRYISFPWTWIDTKVTWIMVLDKIWILFQETKSHSKNIRFTKKRRSWHIKQPRQLRLAKVISKPVHLF